ncbi:hypothetical protein NIES208_04025 [[Limnothrix rosea] IAM M-220]|nr:hypothetical protein NIES208_04025 [[Limnothrix rosea] IAM M-220]
MGENLHLTWVLSGYFLVEMGVILLLCRSWKFKARWVYSKMLFCIAGLFAKVTCLGEGLCRISV